MGSESQMTSGSAFMHCRRSLLLTALSLGVAGCVRSDDGLTLRRFENPFERSNDPLLDTYLAARGAPQALFTQVTLKRPDGRAIAIRLVSPANTDNPLGLLLFVSEGGIEPAILDPLTGPLAAQGWLIAVPKLAAGEFGSERAANEALIDLRVTLDSRDQLIAAGGPMAARLSRDWVAIGGVGRGGEIALAMAGALLPGGRSARDGRIRAVFTVNTPRALILNTPAQARALIVPNLSIIGGGGVVNLAAFTAAAEGSATALTLKTPDQTFGGLIEAAPQRATRGRVRQFEALHAAVATIGVFLDAKIRQRADAAAALKAANGRLLPGLASPLDFQFR
jgi:hypothetical protein